MSALDRFHCKIKLNVSLSTKVLRLYHNTLLPRKFGWVSEFGSAGLTNSLFVVLILTDLTTLSLPQYVSVTQLVDHKERTGFLKNITRSLIFKFYVFFCVFFYILSVFFLFFSALTKFGLLLNRFMLMESRWHIDHVRARKILPIDILLAACDVLSM